MEETPYVPPPEPVPHTASPPITPLHTAPPKRGHGPLFWVGVVGVAFFAVCTAGLLLLVVLVAAARSIAPDIAAGETSGATYTEVTVSGSGSQKIAIISITGVITDRPVQQMFYKTPSLITTVTEQLEQAAEDRSVKAIILEINSPGGGMTATDVLHNEILKFKKNSGKKVIAFMKDVAASGGYYAAVGGDKIIAHPTTITGSIGVIMMMLNVEGLFGKIGVKERVIKSGDFKDMGSSTRPMTEEEEKLFQDIIVEMYGRFVDVVAEGRGMDRAAVESIADGRVYTGEQALKNGMIDSLGYFDDAVELAKQESGLTDAKIIRYRKKVSLSELILSVTAAGARPSVLIDMEALTRRQSPSFMYLWAPDMGQDP